MTSQISLQKRGRERRHTQGRKGGNVTTEIEIGMKWPQIKE